MKKIANYFPFFVAVMSIGILAFLKEPNRTIRIVGYIIYFVGLLLAVLAWLGAIKKNREQEAHINDVEYVLTQAKKDIVLHEELITTLNKAVFFDTCHEVLPDIEAEEEKDNE